MRAARRVWFGVVVACATIVTAVGWVLDADHLFACGLAFLLGAVAAFSHTLLARPASDAYEQGHESGYDKGYCAGRRVAKPVVVDFRDDERAS